MWYARPASKAYVLAMAVVAVPNELVIQTTFLAGSPAPSLLPRPLMHGLMLVAGPACPGLPGPGRDDSWARTPYMRRAEPCNE